MIHDTLSESLTGYKIEPASESTYRDIFRLEQTNPDYFKLEQEEPVTFESCVAGLDLLPPGTPASQKHCLCLYRDTLPTAILDFVEGYPNPQTVYIGFFMLNGNCHRQGFGREIISALRKAASENGYQRFELGVIAENEKGLAFWSNMGFHEIRRVTQTLGNGLDRRLILMESVLQ